MPKLNYKTLRQEVVDEIRQRILTGDFQAGERIKENEMAQQLASAGDRSARRCGSWSRKVWCSMSATSDARLHR